MPASDLNQIASQTDPKLIAIIRDPSRPTAERAQACSLIGQRRSRLALSTLFRVASDEQDSLLVWEALAAIGSLGNQLATPRLIRFFRTTPSSLKRQGAIFALCRLGDPRARGLFVEVVSNANEDETARGLAAEAIGLLPSTKTSTAALIRALDDTSAEVRYSALLALGALRAKIALQAVRRLQNDSTPVNGEGTIGEHAARVVKEIESSPVKPPTRLSRRPAKNKASKGE